MRATGSGWSGGDSNDLTAWTLVRVFHLVARTFGQCLAPYGLTPQQFGVLVQLTENPGQSQGGLARAVLATPQSVGELLRGMERAGLIDRTPPSRPGRAAAVHISAKGRELLDEVTPVVLEAVGAPALGLTDAAYRGLNRDLHRVLSALRDGGQR